MDLTILTELKQYLKPCTIWFTATDDWIGKGIIESQNLILEKMNKKSLFSHVVLCGNDGIIYESTVKSIIKNGYMATPKDKWLEEISKNKDYCHIGVQYNFYKLTNQDWSIITNKAKELVRNPNHYGFLQLLGTFQIAVQYKFAKTEEQRKKILNKNNPYFSKHSSYCVDFVCDCMESSPNAKNYYYGNNSSALVDYPWYFTPLAHEQKKWNLK